MRWASGNPVLRFIAADPKFECAHEGQTAKVWRINDDQSLYTELSCGHPYILQREDLGRLAEPADQESQTALDEALNEEKAPMTTAKATKVASSKGVVPVQGYDAQVKKFKIDLNFHKQLETQVEEAKALFRQLAAQAAEEAEGAVKRVEFLSDDGSATVPVSLPDVSKDGNRSTLKAEVFKEAAKLGVSIEELGVTETSKHYVLRGDFVAWLDQILAANYTAQGKPIPEGIELKEETTLTVGGIEKLRQMLREAKTDNEREAARVILAGGIRAASVSAK